MPVQARVPSHLTADQLLAQIPPDLLASFEKDYRNLLTAHGVRTDAEELDLLRRLIRDAERLGVFWLNGQEVRVNPAVDLSPASPAAIRSQAAGGEGVDRKKNAIRWAVLSVSAIVAVLVLSGLLGRGRGQPPGAVVAEATRPAATLTVVAAAGDAAVTATPLTATVRASMPPSSLPPVTPPSVDSIFDGVKIRVGTFYPKTLEIGGQGFYLVPTSVSPTSGWWIPQGDGAASWVNGSSVNYAIGLPYTERNAAIINSARVGDPVRIRMSTGQVLQFIIQEVKRVSPQQVEIFRQKRPGVTIVLTGEGTSDRLVVIGEYNSAAEVTGGYGSALWGAIPLKVWEPATVGDLAVQIAAVQYYTPSHPAVQGFLPGGQALYVLDFTLRNIGAAPLLLNQVQAEAVDRAQLRYPSMAALAKKYGHVSLTLADAADRLLAAGETITVAAAYMVPREMVRDLAFVVSGAAGDQAVFDLTPDALRAPATPTPTPTPSPSPVPTVVAAPSPAAAVQVAAAVTFDDAAGATPSNGLFLALVLTVTNGGAAPVQLRWTDFVLSCAGPEAGCAGTVYPPAGVYEFDGQLANALPLTVPAQGQLRLVLVYDVADVSAVLLTAGGQEFYIQLRAP